MNTEQKNVKNYNNHREKAITPNTKNRKKKRKAKQKQGHENNMLMTEKKNKKRIVTQR